jgi:hypothetical protein
MASENNKKYLAFISYRHADNKEPGRQWATWLHQAIETYEVPSDLVGTKNARGEVIPERIYPIFRDEEELPADADLGRSIVNALDNTRLLIVLCSPRAVASTYVADEIHYFKQSGHSDRIIAAMIDGEPNTSWDESKLALGYRAEQECFPVPLQYEYDADGVRTDKHAEPIAADFRLNVNGFPMQSWTSMEAYKQDLVACKQYKKEEIEEQLKKFNQQQQLMLLKIIAGILGLPLGELTRRDKEYQLELERQKAKKLRRWLSAVGVLALLAIMAGTLAFFKQIEATAAKNVAETEKANAENSLAEAYAGYGRNELADKQFEEAQLYFQHANQLTAGKVSAEEEFESRRLSLQKLWSKKRGLHFTGLPYVSGNARYVVGRMNDNGVVFDLQQNKTTFSYPITRKGDYLFLISDNGQFVFEFNASMQSIQRIDTRNGDTILLDWLIEKGTTIFIPGETGDQLLAFLTNGNIELLDIPTRTTIDQIQVSDILKVSPKYIEQLKLDWITLLSELKRNYNKGNWTLASKQGLILKLSEHKGTKAPSQKGAILTTDPSVSLLPVSERSHKFALSNDGKRMARIVNQSCQFNQANTDDIDWMRVASHVEVWDLSSQELLRRLPIKWSLDTAFFETDKACGDNPDFEYNLNDQQRRIAGRINNFMIDMTLFWGTDDNVKLNYDGNNYVVSTDNIDLPIKYNHQITKDLAKASNDGVVIVENVSQYSPVNTAFNTEYWVYQVKDKVSSEPKDNQWFQFSSQRNNSGKPLSSVVSFDQRFLISLFSNGVIDVINLLDGKSVASKLSRADADASMLCQTENSHHVILVSQAKVQRVDWLTGDKIWEKPLQTTHSQVSSCASSLKFSEFTIVKSSSEKLSPQESGNGNVSEPIEDEESRIIRMKFDGTIVEQSLNSQRVLNRPLFIDYTGIENQVYVASMSGVTLYDLDAKNIIDYMMLGEQRGEYGFPTSIETSNDFVTVYVGYSNGKLFKFVNGKPQLLADLEMPIVDVFLSGGHLKITTGYNSLLEVQLSNVALTPKETFRSYLYQLDLDTLTLRKLRGYGDQLVERVGHVYSGHESVVEFSDGAVSYFRRSAAEPVVKLINQSGTKKEFTVNNNARFYIDKSVNGFEFTHSAFKHSINLPISNQRQFMYLFLDGRKWLMLAVEDDNFYDINTYLINTENLTISARLQRSEGKAADRISLVDLHEDNNQFLSCGGEQCSFYDLENLTMYQNFSDYAVEPDDVFKIGESISNAIYMGDDVALTSLSGKVQTWGLRQVPNTANDDDLTDEEEETSVEQDSENNDSTHSGSIASNARYVLLNERSDQFYKNIIYDPAASQLFVADRTQAYMLKPDLSLVSTIAKNFSSGHVLRADLASGWLLFVEKNGTGTTVDAQIYDLKEKQTTSYFFISASSIISMNEIADDLNGVLDWRDDNSNIMSLNINKAVQFGREYLELDDVQKIAVSETLSGKYLDQVTVFSQSSASTSGLLVNALTKNSVNNGSDNAVNLNAPKDSLISINSLVPAQRSYRHDWFLDFALYTDTWAVNEKTLLDEVNFQKRLVASSESATKREANIDLRVVSLENKIKQLFNENKDISSDVNELEKIAPDHFFVKFVTMQRLFQVNSYQAFQYGIAYLSELGGGEPIQTSLFVGNSPGITNDSNRSINVEGVDPIMLHKFSGGVFAAAVQSGLFRKAHELLKVYPGSFTNPQFSQGLFVQLTNLGLYDKAEKVLAREISNLETYGNMTVNQRSKQTHESYLRYQRMLSRYNTLREQLVQLEQLPILCLGDIQPASGMEASQWKHGDCILKIDGQRPKDLASTYPQLQLAASTRKPIDLLRQGQPIELAAPSSLAGGAWNMVGYDGRYIIRVKTLKPGSVAEKLGIKPNDYLLAVNDELLESPLQIMKNESSSNKVNSQSNDATINKNLWIYRPEKGAFQQANVNTRVKRLIGEHPVAYWPGELLETKLTEYSDLGVSIEMVLMHHAKPSR